MVDSEESTVLPSGCTVAACLNLLSRASEVDVAMRELAPEETAIFEINGAEIRSSQDLFRAFAIALRMPQGWYGDEEYATNSDAFLEYLDDIREWCLPKCRSCSCAKRSCYGETNRDLLVISPSSGNSQRWAAVRKSNWCLCGEVCVRPRSASSVRPGAMMPARPLRHASNLQAPEVCLVYICTLLKPVNLHHAD